MQSNKMNLNFEDLSLWQLFLIFLKLGCTSFGGPIAHLGYFREEFVGRRQWLSDAHYADMVALCQFLPGPASSQVGLMIGLEAKGKLGACVAWAGFTLPSVVFLMAAALGLSLFNGAALIGVIHALKIVATIVVAHALRGMLPKLCPDLPRIGIMLLSVMAVFAFQGMFAQMCVICVAACFGQFLKNEPVNKSLIKTNTKISNGGYWLCIYLVCLIGFSLLSAFFSFVWLDVISTFFSTGALVFGGGHVVLPLLQSGVVEPGWMSNDTFLAGYGLTQAVPGPLFTLSAFLGVMLDVQNTGQIAGVLGEIICVCALFLPSLLLVFGIMPYWSKCRELPWVYRSLKGVNAAVAGLLLAAFITPVVQQSILSPYDVGWVLLGYYLLSVHKLPAWLIILGAIGLGIWI